MPKKSPSGATPALQVLAEAGVTHVLRTYKHDPRAGSFAAEAADLLGVPPERVLRTLLADVDGMLVVAIVPVSVSLDLKLLAAAVGGKHAAMAPVEQAERVTGYVAGGISPLGQRAAHPTVLDASALTHSTVLVSGGRRGLDIEIDPHDLVDLTNARVAPLARKG
jgi:Cys-tRNA(Pro)/Cys-tRNA(Cys) deacylase